jgi:diaminopimelate decarboxylase
MKDLCYKSDAQQQNVLFIENMAISEIAAAIGTPFYCYSKKSLINNFQNFTVAFAAAGISDYKICYAIKANYNIHLVKILVANGAGIDAVSGGEIFRALKARANPKKIVFAGVGKTRGELEFALKNGVEEFSVESVAEMFLLNEVALALGKKAKFLLRVNPDIDAKTHDKISTGRKGDKFGVNIEQAAEIYARAAKLSGLEIHGIATHIGSQITTLEPFRAAFKKLRALCLHLRNAGHKISVLDFGGGIGISYKNENIMLIQDYVKLIKEITANLDVKITIAPGRAIIGNSGIMVTKVLFLKEAENFGGSFGGNLAESPGENPGENQEKNFAENPGGKTGENYSVRNFAIIDAAMNDLMRPGLYGSYHEVLPVIKKTGPFMTYDLAGPVCESTDILAHNRKLNILKPEELLVFCGAGAYGSAMSGQYNCRPLIPEILADGSKFSVIRRRPSFEEMLFLEDF